MEVQYGSLETAVVLVMQAPLTQALKLKRKA